MPAQNQKTPISYSADKVTIKTKEDIVLLQGNAIVKKDDAKLNANFIEVDNKKEYLTATGNVKFENRKKGIVYIGNKIKYDMKKRIVYGDDRPTIKRKENKIHFTSNTVRLDLNKNLMTGEGDVLLFSHKNTLEEIKATSHFLKYDIDNEEMYLMKNVIITESGKNKKRFNSGSIIHCDNATHFTQKSKIICKGNSQYKNIEKGEKLTAKLFVYDQKKEEIEAKRNAYYEKKEKEEIIKVKSHKIFLEKKKNILTLDGNAKFFRYRKKDNVLTHQANCLKAKIYQDKKSKNTKKKEKKFKIVECWENVMLRRPQDKATIRGSYLYYSERTKKGFMNNRPVITVEKDNLINVFSNRLELDDEKKDVTFIGKVLIREQKKKTNEVISTINCDKGKYLYKGNVNIDEEKGEVFQCHENVVLKKPKEKITMFMDKINHYTNKQLTEMRGNLRFVKKEKDNQEKKGTAGEVDLDGKLEKVFFRKGLVVHSYKNNVKQETFSGEKGHYHYKKKERFFEASKDIKVFNFTEEYRVFSDFFHYDVEKKVANFTGRVMLEKDEKLDKKNLAKKTTKKKKVAIKKVAYGKTLSIEEDNKKALLKENVVVVEVDKERVVPRHSRWVKKSPKENNYLTCDNGVYFFEEKVNEIECKGNVFTNTPKQNRTMSSDSIFGQLNEKIYKSEGNVVIVEDDKKKKFIRYIKANLVTLDDNVKITTFEKNISILSKDRKTKKTTQKIKCQKGIYDFSKKKNRVLFCHDDVEINDYKEKYKMMGDLLRYYLDTKYGIVTGNPIFLSKSEKKITKITADVFEYFEKENLLHTKGNVKITNDKYKISSSFGNYDLKKKEITLFEKTEIENKDGSKMVANHLIVDTEKNNVQLKKNIKAHIILEKSKNEKK